MIAFEDKMRQGGDAAIREAGRFFMRDDPVHQTLATMAERFAALGIPYAVVGGMALVAHGYDRTTVDVDVLVTRDSLTKIQDALPGLGYLPIFQGSRAIRDVGTGVRIEFLVTGDYPGDGKPKPIAFPDPGASNVEIHGIRYIPLPTLFELKLASGMTNPGRLRDLADVQELIRVLKLPTDYAAALHPYVREKFHELCIAIEGQEPSVDWLS